MATYKSQYTGAQIDEAVGKANNLVANNGEATTADLSTLKVGDVNYKIPEGAEPIDVVANNGEVTTEDLSTLKVGDTNYKIPEVDDSKYLTIPDTTPDSPRIVSIATDGTQQNLALGDGITVENGVISASGGGGISLYRHTIGTTSPSSDDYALRYMSFISTDERPLSSFISNLSLSDIVEYLALANSSNIVFKGLYTYNGEVCYTTLFPFYIQATTSVFGQADLFCLNSDGTLHTTTFSGTLIDDVRAL